MSHPEKKTGSSLREVFGVLTLPPAETSRLSEAGKARIQLLFDTHMGTYRDKVADQIRASRDMLISHNVSITPARLTAESLIDFAGSVENLSLQHQFQDQEKEYSLYDDMAAGIRLVRDTIVRAERTDTDMTAEDIFLHYELGVDGGKGLRLATLVGESIQEGNGNMFKLPDAPKRLKEFVAAGAEIGSYMYRKLYPLAEEILAA